MAGWYAREHLKTDPGIRSVHYLPTNAPDREIRLIEVNSLIGNRSDENLEPIDFGVDTGIDTEHKLFVVDVTPRQWEQIQLQKLKLPVGWSLQNAKSFTKRSK